jgi:hypothetical protein
MGGRRGSTVLNFFNTPHRFGLPDFFVKSNPMSYGKDGRPLHEAMINLIPWVLNALQRVWPDMRVGGSVDEAFTHYLMGNLKAGRKNRLIPDGIICWDGGGVLIEIGMCNADKWPKRAWIHWSFTGHTTVINHNGDPMIDEVAEYLQIAAESPNARLARLTNQQLAA